VNPTNVCYVIDDGALLRLYHGRPETAWPGEAARQLCAWNDPNGEWLTVEDGGPLVSLTDCAAQLNDWITEDPKEAEHVASVFAKRLSLMQELPL